jgi:hypothetical protein
MPNANHGEAGAIAFETQSCRLVVGTDGRALEFVDRRSGVDYLRRDHRASFATVVKDGVSHPSTGVYLADDALTIDFHDAATTAVVRVEARPTYFALEVLSLAGDGVEEFVIADIPLTLLGVDGEPFAGCALALSLQTNVTAIPAASDRLRASCYPRFGFAGAKVALIGCAPAELRSVLQEAVSDAPDLPHSPLGGPWALEPSINRGSYLFNFADLTEDTADAWIGVAEALGFDQIDFHGGRSFRFGDCRPDPVMYPDGLPSLKAAVDKLHAAGISAGLHTYAHCIAKDTAWVTPVPDPGLASDATFTLAANISAEDTTIPVVESTEDMSTVTGLFSRNSVTLRVGEELVTYSGVNKKPPYAFTGCERGAVGTTAASHGSGSEAHHLLEFFGLFAPDGESALLEAVAAKTAEAFNTCGFDMMYLDALDAEDMMGGPENAWHYGSKFVFELVKRLDKPAVMEMSTFHHHLWFVRSRLGAWDHPRRGYKAFIDIHCASNGQVGGDGEPAVGDHGFSARRHMLPGHLGWWAALPWDSPQQEATFTDDIEYLCGKALASDSSFSIMQVDPERLATSPGLQRLAAICKKYERLRRAGRVPESVKKRLRAAGSEFTLSQVGDDGWQFRPVKYSAHKTRPHDDGADRWTTHNAFARQEARLRIEALLSAGGYDDPGAPVLVGAGDGRAPDRVETAEGVAASVRPSRTAAPCGGAAYECTGRNEQAERRGAWTKFAVEFAEPLDLTAYQGIGVWVHGDGLGEVLNFQVKSPEAVALGSGDHYVVVDFTGWRYIELVEFEGVRCAEYQWPYSRDLYSIFRESVNFASVGALNVWYNELPPGGDVSCLIGPVKALPLIRAALRDPWISVGGDRLTFPGEIEPGCHIEYSSADDCTLCGVSGEPLMGLAADGQAPMLLPGDNLVEFGSAGGAGGEARARVTIIADGEPLPEIC